MKKRILYVERKPNEYVSLEKVFRQLAASLSENFDTDFQQMPFGPKVFDTYRNLLFFRKRPADIYHITGHIHYIALLFSPENTVLSIHDLRFLSAKGRLRRYILKKLYLDLPVARLRYITAISEQTKREIISKTYCDPDSVRVMDLPLLEHLAEYSPKEFNASVPLILQVGTMKNKNIPNLVRALKGINCKLRIVGMLSDEQVNCLQKNAIAYENVYDLSDEEMKLEYRNADVVVFCSKYEGFGLPIIEAQAAGRPVITSNISPMTETSGGAACFVDPFDVENIRNGIMKVFTEEQYRLDLIAAGLKNVERFRPERVAKQYERLYAEILSELSAST